MKNIEKTLRRIGFKILSVGKKNATGPDIWVIKNKIPRSVECKMARITARRSWQVPPVEKNRMNDDLIAIEFENGYVLVEPISDHLSACGKGGFRTLTILG
jgi:hypothetical protein